MLDYLETKSLLSRQECLLNRVNNPKYFCLLASYFGGYPHYSLAGINFLLEF